MEIVAEIGASHGQNLETALRLCRGAANSGADAVKIQVYDKSLAKDDMVLGTGPWAGKKLSDLYSSAMLPTHFIHEIISECDNENIGWFSSVFDMKGLELLEKHQCPRYKISSFEITQLNLIAEVCKTGKPIVISTGMATFDEIRRAFETAKFSGAVDITLLKCTTAYPASLQDANLKTIEHMESSFDCKMGVSDHTLCLSVPIVCGAMALDMLERHIKLDSDNETADAAFATPISRFSQVVEAARDAEDFSDVLGSISYGPTNEEMQYLSVRKARGG